MKGRNEETINIVRGSANKTYVHSEMPGAADTFKLGFFCCRKPARWEDGTTGLIGCRSALAKCFTLRTSAPLLRHVRHGLALQKIEERVELHEVKIIVRICSARSPINYTSTLPTKDASTDTSLSI